MGNQFQCTSPKTRRIPKLCSQSVGKQFQLNRAFLVVLGRVFLVVMLCSTIDAICVGPRLVTQFTTIVIRSYFLGWCCVLSLWWPMETKLERLLKDRAGVAHERSALNTKLSAELRGIHRHRRRVANDWQVPKHIWASALWLYMECDWSVEPAVKFLRAIGAHKRWRSVNDVELQAMLENEFLAVEECELLGLRAAHATRTDSSARRAQTCKAEWRLVVWCRAMNAEHGVAPSTADLIGKALELAVTGAAALRARTKTGRPNTVARKWASRHGTS